MISLRRILHLKGMYPVNSLPFSATNWMRIPVCNQRVGDENIVRLLKFGSVRYFGTSQQWMRRTTIGKRHEEKRLSEFDIQVEKKFECINQERATVGSMMNAIDCLAIEHLLDEKDLREKDLDICSFDEKDSCTKYWLAVFEGSKTPLAVVLEEKLKNAGISHQDFCRKIVTIYFTLNRHQHFLLPSFKIKPEDVLNTINRLHFDKTQYECLRILFSLHESYGWKI